MTKQSKVMGTCRLPCAVAKYWDKAFDVACSIAVGAPNRGKLKEAIMTRRRRFADGERAHFAAANW